MKKTRLPPRSGLSRRDVLKGAAALGAVGLFGCGPSEFGDVGSSSKKLNGGKPRVAIVGGGAGGIGAAYLLQGACDVVMFESRSKVGGNCDTRPVDYQGKLINVDLGAQFFHPDTHPIYVTMLEELGIYKPDSPDTDDVLEFPGSLCLFKYGGGWPVFSSANPLLTPFLSVDFAIYAQAARQAILGNMSWEITLEDWINGLGVTQNFKDSIAFPWLSSLIGADLPSAKRSSARAILQTFALAFPANIFSTASSFNSKIGLEGNLRRMLDSAPDTEVHVDSPVQSTSFDGTAWTVTTPQGVYGPFDAVVMNAPPHVSKELLRPLDWTSNLVQLLDRYEYFDARIVIHTDAKYVHPTSSLWAAYNGMIDGANSEGSVWYGAIHGKLPNGKPINLFKSWAQRRRADPANILYDRHYRHPLITPDVIRAARELSHYEGINGLYFSGQQTLGMDLQESALYSAMKVASALAPTSPTLASLRARLQLRNRANINYDL